MNGFADILNRMVVQSFTRFIQEHQDETPYGFAVITGQACNYLGFAVATEENLIRTVGKYIELGYGYQACEWESYDLEEKLRLWLRWANPDDGWYNEDFDDSEELQPFLEELQTQNSCDELLEIMCVDTLRQLVRGSQWLAIISSFRTIVGVTAGEDPDDFLRTSTMLNEHVVVNQLWREYRQMRALDSRIFAS